VPEPQLTLFIYYTSKEIHSTEFFKAHYAMRPVVGEEFVIHPYEDTAQRAIALEITELTTPSGVDIVEVLCDIPKVITVTMGCGHIEEVPNTMKWIMAERDPETKCSECWFLEGLVEQIASRGGL
jgi:hypothetical protein